MVLDPLSGVSLASSIVQLVDVSVKVIERTSEIRERSQLVRSQDLAMKTEQLRTLAKKLIADLPKTSRLGHAISSAPGSTTCEDPVINIALLCKDAADKLITALDKVKKKHKNSWFESFRAALRSVWEEGKIMKLEIELEKYKNDLLIHIMVDLTLIQK